MIKAAEAQRNVVFQLSLVANPKNKSVAGKMIKTFEEIETAAIKAAKAAADIRVKISEKELKKREQFNNELLNSINRLGEESLKETQETNKKVVGQLRKITKRMKKIWESLEDAKTDKTKKESDKREKCLENEAKASEKLKAAYKKQIESQQKATEAGLAALQGVMDLTEGLANLGLMSDENFKKFEQGFQKIEAGYKALKGFTELVWKGREALIALSEATKAQATANALLSAGNMRVSATQKTAAVAGGAAGNIIIGAGGRGAAAGNGIAAGGIAAAGVSTGGLALLAVAAAALVAVFYSMANAADGFAEGLKKAHKEREKERSQEYKSREAEQDQREIQDDIRQDAYFAREAGFRNSRRGTQELQDRTAFEIGGDSRDPITEANYRSAAALREVQAAEQEVERARTASAKERFRSASQLEEKNKDLINIERQRLSIMRDQEKSVKEQLEASKDAIKSAQDAQNSVHQNFAGLSEYKQGRLREIDEKVRAGDELTERDIRFLERTPGYGSDAVREYRSRQGIAAGSQSVAETLGDNFRDQQKAEADARKRAREAEENQRRAAAGQQQAEQVLLEASPRQSELFEYRVKKERFSDRVDRFREKRLRELEEEKNNPEPDPEPLEGFNPFDPDANRDPEPWRPRPPIRLRDPDANRDPVNNPAGNAADQVVQTGIGVEQALAQVLSAVAQNNSRLEDTVYNSELMKGYYA